ncbi:hypothetical protein J2045_000208 [Peteryoungia aggregata LMG 23059]|uniref:AbiV family abortive infection protein n=1 Tax=Peteryoungia aggregata LMG 23059 TaxID=1368425 RepID=A0ABU0G267_9HYPH|nr:hypothetical protein [Peteryoungia aggregata]MDQ0419198.1 hypothetical protein [Peteryoungia aggregata LMG 23059]
MPKIENSWLRIDERTDVLASLAVCLTCLHKVTEHPMFWKQVLVSLHNGLQGSMVCHLSGTAQMGALDERSWRKAHEWHDKDRAGKIEYEASEEDGWPVRRAKSAKDEFPAQRLADAKTLFSRLSSETLRLEAAGPIILVTDGQINSFDRLHSLRNGLSHFAPAGWSIELAGLPKITLDCLNVVKSIFEGDWAFRHMSSDEKTALAETIESLEMHINAMLARTPTEA